MLEKTLTGILTIVFFGIMALAIALGVTASSFWVGALAFIGVLLALVNIGAVGNTEEANAGFYILHILSIAAIACAAWLAGLQPLWMVIVLMGFTSLPPVFVSDYAFKRGVGSGILITFFTTLSIPLAVALPAILQKMPPETWAWSLAIGAIAILAAGLLQAASTNTAEYFICAGVGLVTLTGAVWAMGFNIGWWWLIPCLVAALLIGGGAFALPHWRSKVWIVGLVFAILLGLVSVGLPLMKAGILPNPFTPAGESSVAETTPEGTLSAVDIAATQLAAAEATATQAYLDEQEQGAAVQTQTQQALALAEGQTQTAIAAYTSTPSPVPTATVTPVPAVGSDQEGPGFFKAIGTFLWQAIKSIWGIVYLIIIIGIGQTWIKRWGGFALFILLLAGVGFFGGKSANALDIWVDLVTSGPANWWTYIFSVSTRLTGTIGWGILATALILTIILIPALKIANRFSQQAQLAQKMQQREGETAAQNFISNEMMGCRNFLATYIYLTASSVIPITLWIALYRISAESGNAFPFLFIPDLAIPHWRPVWHYSYFVIGGIFMLCYFLYVQMIRKHQAENPFSKIGAWAAIPVSILMTLLAPSGAVLFLTGQLLLIAMLIPLLPPEEQPYSFRPPRPAPPKPEASDPFADFVDDIQKLAEEENLKLEDLDFSEPVEPGDTIEPRQIPSEPQQTRGYLEGAAMTTLSTPLIGGYLIESNRLCILDQDGRLFWLVNGIHRADQKLDLTTPSALLAAGDNHLVAVGHEGKIISITASPTFDVEPALDLGTSIQQSTVNSYGTLMAYVPESDLNEVHGLFITAKRDQLFLSLSTENVSCLAFSTNARYLGIGTDMGRLVVMDIATHRKVLEVPDPHLGPVEMIGVTEDEKWICVYKDGWLAGWDIQGAQKGLVELSTRPVSLAIHQSQRLVLVGDEAGYLWGYPQSLESLSFNKQVQNGTVSHIFIAPDGSIATAGDGRELRSLVL